MNACNDPDLIEELAEDFVQEDRDTRRSAVLLRFAEQTLSPDTLARLAGHVERCADCAQRVAEWRRLQSLGRQREQITYAECPSSSGLYAYLHRSPPLSAVQQQGIEQHLAQCDLCQEELDWLQQLNTRAAALSLVEAKPAELTVRRLPARRLWAAAAAILLLMLSAAVVYRMTRPKPEPSNPYAQLVRFPEIEFEEFEDYRPDDSAQAERYDQGLRLCREGQYEQARPMLETILPARPDNPGVEFLLGYAYFKTGHAMKAYDYCARAEALSPKSAQRCWFLLHLCLQLAKPERAMIEVYEHPGDPEWEEVGRQIKQIQSACGQWPSYEYASASLSMLNRLGRAREIHRHHR